MPNPLSSLDLINAIDVYQYWDSLPGRKLRTEFDPLEVGGRALPHVSLCHSLKNGTDIRYDLIGTSLKIVAPRLKPGSLASEPAKLLNIEDGTYAFLCDAVCTQQPKGYEAAYLSVEGIMRHAFILLLPLGLAPLDPCCEDLLVGVWLLKQDQTHPNEEITDCTDWFLDAVVQYTRPESP